MEASLPRPATQGPGRTLGLDVGDRRIGVAICDPDGRVAVPLRAIERDGRGGEFQAIDRIAREDEVTTVVVGLPLSLSGERGPQAQRTEEFARELGERCHLPVVLWDERLSTHEAERLRSAEPKGGRRPPRRTGRRERPERGEIDALAATIILQAYLDSQRYRTSSEE